MECKGRREQELYEDFIQSEILLYCLKNCIAKHEISPEIKVKILFLLFDDYKYFGTKAPVHTLVQDSVNSIVFNPLGVDNDLFEKSPELLTYEQTEQLREYILDELKKIHSLCSSIRASVKLPQSRESFSECIDLLKGNLKKQVSALDLNLSLLKKAEDIKLAACSVTYELGKNVVARLKEVLNDERKLFDEIVEAMEEGERRIALEKVEDSLEQRIKKNKKLIDELNFELSEYYNA